MRAARTPWFSSSRMALMVVAGRAGDGLAELDRVFAAVPEHDRRADGGLDDQVVGLGAGQAEQDAGVGHRLDEEVEVRGARAGERGGRVLLGLGDPESLADAAEDRLGVVEVLGGGVAARGDDGHALVHQDGGVRHDAYDRGARGEALLDEAGGDAGGGADDEAVGGDVRGQLVEEPAHVLGLDRQDEDVGALGGLGVGDGLDAVAGAELLGTLGAAGGHQQVTGAPAGGSCR